MFFGRALTNTRPRLGRERVNNSLDGLPEPALKPQAAVKCGGRHFRVPRAEVRSERVELSDGRHPACVSDGALPAESAKPALPAGP